MQKWIPAMAIAGLACVLSPRNADACEPSGWDVDQQEGECLELRGFEDTYLAANVCDDALTLTAEVCPATCPQAVEIAPGEEVPLELPEQPKNDDKFRFVSTKDDVVTLLYVENVCPSAPGDCSFRQSDSHRGGSVFLISVALWGARRLRKKVWA